MDIKESDDVPNTQHVEITKQVTTKLLEWPENITEIELTDQCLMDDMLESSKLPPNLISLNLSQNELGYIPTAVVELVCLKDLNISNNKIEFFDEIPSFCQSIERLNLARNELNGPPYWVWSERPQKLKYLNISQNAHLSYSLTDEYMADLLSHQTPVRHIVADNCKLGKKIVILSAFVEAKELEIGNRALKYFTVNSIDEFPDLGLDQCCNLERINLSNTRLFQLSSKIDIYKDLTEIDLSVNNLTTLPDEICNLKKLRVCVLSQNHLLYLPDRFTELEELMHLHLDSNELCILPSLSPLINLKLLDLYNNSLSEMPDGIENVSELDLAQNYFVETEEFEARKAKLRSRKEIYDDRIDGNKIYLETPPSEHSTSEFTDDDDISWSPKTDCEDNHRPPSSIEDWDSDDYWVPCPPGPRVDPPESPWLNFIRRKMREGNFCPIDMHTLSIIEKVRYEQLLNPRVVVEVPGQFDDLTDDESCLAL